MEKHLLEAFQQLSTAGTFFATVAYVVITLLIAKVNQANLNLLWHQVQEQTKNFEDQRRFFSSQEKLFDEQRMALAEERVDRRRDAALVIFDKLQTEQVRNARRYILSGQLPRNVENISDKKLQEHLERSEEALIAFDRIGYLIDAKQVDPEPFMALYWTTVWRCWKRSEETLRWAREKRKNPTHFEYFLHLFEESERYRREKKHEEPKL